jgi:cathepsin F/cysteine peptidase B
MLKSIATVAAFATVAFAKTGLSPMVHVSRERMAEPEWASFVTFTHDHARTYKTAEEVHARFNNFKATVAKNVVLSKLNPLATFGINKFSDMSEAEFRSTHLMPVNITSTYRQQHKMKKWVAPKHPSPMAAKARQPDGAVDWCAAGACTPVKDQQQCGSCWAFSATEVLESFTFISGKGLPDLAPEQIVDCDTNDSGCNGGDPRSALTYVQGAGGEDTESSYPYTAGGGQAGTCAFSASNVGATTNGPVDVSDGTESSLQAFLQATGPPSVCVDASSWSSYTGGVLSSCGCNIDHAVQATGISADGSYYIVRNSWNTNWGENGFIYLQTGANTCCVANEVSWAS